MRRTILLCGLLCIAVPAMAQDNAQPRAELERPTPGRISSNNRQALTPHINRIARKYNVEAALVKAVIAAESGFDPQAVSVDGAMGLMQLMPATAADYGLEDPFDPVANIDAGTRVLRDLLRRYKNISHALAAYNAGAGATDRHRRAVPYTETRKFVVRVIKYYRSYKGG